MFPDEDLLIFSVDVGGSLRRYDPLVLRRNLTRAAGGRLGDMLKAAAEPTPYPGQPPAEEIPEELVSRLDAQEKLVGVLRVAFGLPEVDVASGKPGGVPEETLLRVWFEWRAWLKKKGQSTRTSPTSTPSADGVQPPSASSLDLSSTSTA